MIRVEVVDEARACVDFQVRVTDTLTGFHFQTNGLWLMREIRLLAMRHDLVDDPQTAAARLMNATAAAMERVVAGVRSREVVP